MMKNYLDLGRFLLIYQRFVFLDTEDYLADQLFIRHRVRVRFGDEYVHPEHPYRSFYQALSEIQTHLSACPSVNPFLHVPDKNIIRTD